MGHALVGAFPEKYTLRGSDMWSTECGLWVEVGCSNPALRLLMPHVPHPLRIFTDSLPCEKKPTCQSYWVDPVR